MRRDDAYLLDILIAARDATGFIAELRHEDFLASTLHRYAIVKAIEIIGEAAARITPETKVAHPEIPWAEMTGMRNRLVHGYFDVDLQKVWDTLKRDLPGLIELISPLVPPEPR